MEIKTLQWNIGGGRICRNGADPALADSYTENGLNSIIELIKAHQPDVVTLQETHESAGFSQTQTTAEAIGYSYHVNDAYDDSFIEKGQRIGQAVISKYPIVENGFVGFTNPKFKFIDENGGEIVSKNGGITACVVEFPDKKLMRAKTFHMTPFHFFSVDLESEQADAVLREVEILIGRPKMPTLIQADFNLNFQSIEPLFGKMFSAGMREAIQEEPTTPKGKRFDHILYAKIELLSSEVIKDVRTDHYPVISRFQL